MADISDINSALSVKIVGADATGLEQTPVTSTSSGALHSNIRDTSGTELATSSNPLRTDPTGTTAQPVTDNGGTLTVDQSTASNFNAQVVGNVAAAATDSGNPIKTGGIYTSTIPLLTSGQRGDDQIDENSIRMTTDHKTGYAAMQKVYHATNLVTLTVGTSETAIYLFKNPNGSGIKVRIYRIVFTGAATYRIYHTPTTSANGTALTAVNNRIMTSPTAAVATPFQSPTASANGTFMMPINVSTQTGTFVLQYDSELILNPNFNLLITAQAGGNNTPVNATVFWYEVL